MTDLSLTKTKLQSGIWQGIVTGTTETPQIEVTHLNDAVDGVTISEGPEIDSWLVQIPIPSDAIADGVQTLLIADKASDEVLEKITLIAGEALGDDLRAEVDLLRAELDMLKRAFRRHCLETTL